MVVEDLFPASGPSAPSEAILATSSAAGDDGLVQQHGGLVRVGGQTHVSHRFLGQPGAPAARRRGRRPAALAASVPGLARRDARRL
jgi:hypothetical protein